MLMCEPPSSPLLRLFKLLRGQGPGLCVQPGLDAVHYQLQSAYRSVGRKADADREANIYRAMKAKSRSITLPPPRLEPSPQRSPSELMMTRYFVNTAILLWLGAILATLAPGQAGHDLAPPLAAAAIFLRATCVSILAWLPPPSLILSKSAGLRGATDVLHDLPADQFYSVLEGKGIVSADAIGPRPAQ